MSVRIRTRSDGSTVAQVRFRHDGRETSLSFDDVADATRFDQLLSSVGPARALAVTRTMLNADPQALMTLGEWLTHYNDHLTGVEEQTLRRYQAMAAKDLAPLADMPLITLSPEDVSRWLKAIRKPDGSLPSGKTIANKHGYLAAALNVAVKRKLLPANPCEDTRLPEWDRLEMTFLEPDEYRLLREALPKHWRPLVEFLVTSGARWGEATALRPADVNRANATVRISRAWKRSPSGYKLGTPKTRKSVRTIDIPEAVLEQLDYTGEFLFTNSGRGRRNSDGVIRIHNFRPNVWVPALDRAAAAGLTKRPRVHDLRHTCASWLIQAGRPLPAVQEQMGHESILTTVGIYNHLERTSGRQNADVMARLLDSHDDVSDDC